MTGYRLTADAQDDLVSIGEFIWQGNPERAISFVDELTGRFRIIADRPKSFPARDHVLKGLRSAGYGRYLILFRLERDHILILRVLHSARNVAKILRDQAQ